MLFAAAPCPPVRQHIFKLTRRHTPFKKSAFSGPRQMAETAASKMPLLFSAQIVSSIRQRVQKEAEDGGGK
jgi:hypothetical protein